MAELEGQIFLIQRMPGNFHDLATKASIQKDIDKGDFIPPPGHVSILKTDPEDESRHTIISTGGADFEQGKEWGFSGDLFGTHFESINDKFEVLKVEQVQSFFHYSSVWRYEDGKVCHYVWIFWGNYDRFKRRT